MEQVKQIEIILDLDINQVSENELTEILYEAFKEKGYTPTDKPVVVREGKISSVRAVKNDSQEEVELYAFAKVLKKGDKAKTYISARVV
ncbi:MAG: hypothetical protein D6831_01355 [Aquificota bacterium]|nr:MAG: hypothetical protein D6831_01355 [Aquificota bacterium]